MHALTLCQACRRHVRVDETTCPFCREALPVALAAPATRVEGLGRAALLFLGVSAAACGGPRCPPPGTARSYARPETVTLPDGGHENVTVVPIYGAPDPRCERN